ncbi:NAD(P)-binding protein [Hyaloscypha bicolor E]|uniref:NAD(P)-binding protein n=1 Tax=Hyaloscypha bicolor E TaxID=1095630 RepID=A0A2J6SQ12_9HELO|nr:NAD(P)-binding protein [Hyaloscypha bicolor E]PMD52823.1 NAD(P)-binding protein [Hyaloscypha bicolor E]
MASSVATLNRSNDAYLNANVFDLFSLKERVVVITGGARGIGLALGFAVAEAGGVPVMIDANGQPHGHFQILQKMCPKMKLYVSDVTNYERLEKTFNEIIAEYGRIDGCITAAGICPDQPFLERSPASVKRCFDINIAGTFFTTQLAARQMDKQAKQSSAAPSASKGSIVLIASIAAHRASKGQFLSDYCTSKGAVASMAKALAVELAEKSIRVNYISPGYIMTDMTLAISDTRPGLAKIFVDDPPMKRMGDRTDLKGAAVYLLSDSSAYMTGGELLITGGLHAGLYDEVA